jgi:hypothetical protein
MARREWSAVVLGGQLRHRRGIGEQFLQPFAPCACVSAEAGELRDEICIHLFPERRSGKCKADRRVATTRARRIAPAPSSPRGCGM